MDTKHIDAISCGQGAPSVFLVAMAGEGMFDCDAVIVADTGWENDMLWSTGERTTAREYFERVTAPLADSYGISAYFVRSKQFDGTDYLPLHEAQLRAPRTVDKPESRLIDIPLYGSRGGRLAQTCTSKWKIQAVKQQLRALGAATAATALGLHRDEAHRIKPAQGNWYTHTWPLLDLRETGTGGAESMGIGRRWSRVEIEREMDARNIPYLVTTECDGCPHKDWPRWQRTDPAVIKELAAWEKKFDELYLTDKRKPLLEALDEMEREYELRNDPNGQMSLFDGCDSGYCFT